MEEKEIREHNVKVKNPYALIVPLWLHKIAQELGLKEEYFIAPPWPHPNKH